MSQGVGYSRDAAVSAVRSFYEFLTTFPALSPSAIKEPPPSGWPDIDASSHAPLKRNDEVIDLLRNLPYIDENSGGNTQIAFETRAIQYNGPSVKWSLGRNKLEGTILPVGCGELPDYVAVLTMGARYGSWLLLNTREGTITDFIQQERPERDEPPQGDPEHWRAYKTLPIAEFFESWKENYRTLEWVAIPDNVDDGVLLRHDKQTDEVRVIYRAHGWPSSFRREECKEALLEWDQRPKY